MTSFDLKVTELINDLTRKGRKFGDPLPPLWRTETGGKQR